MGPWNPDGKHGIKTAQEFHKTTQKETKNYQTVKCKIFCMLYGKVNKIMDFSFSFKGRAMS